jgi:epoxyqueuosine reductase
MHHDGWIDGPGLLGRLQGWAIELGFSQITVADVDLSSAEAGLLAWLGEGCHGDMHYMAAHGLKRARPAELVPGTLRVISARMDYLPRDNATLNGERGPADDATPDPPPAGALAPWQAAELARLAQPAQATVSIYARGRDYHKVLRARLQRLADRLAAEIGPFGHRVFTDSAPVLEVELAARSGGGWRGKHTLLLDRHGSMSFIGELFVDLALPLTPAASAHCGRCTRCLEVCPTQAITAPYRLDARRCISYLTIEHEGAIPVDLRRAIGNRIVGCDDCQLVCPWNRHARRASLPDFDEREPFAAPTLLALWQWDEAAFLRHTEGSAIRRIGHRRWRRNLAVAIGNALAVLPRGAESDALRAALAAVREAADELVREHIDWALAQRDGGPGPGGTAATIA